MKVDYTIVRKPSSVVFECPHCGTYADVDFNSVYFNTDYWVDGAFAYCPICEKRVELGDYEYDRSEVK